MDESLDEPGQGEGRARHPKASKEDRAAELAARLRDNLRRRKDQARARESGAPEPAGAPAPQLRSGRGSPT